jgi:DNA-binding NtrC family response regulator
VAHALRCLARVMNTMTAPTAAAPLLPRPIGYHGAVSDFKRRLIEATLHQMRGNRTHTARALGLQRTYLLRLIRELGVAAPPPPPRRRSDTG